jgi:hypothetical protein
MTFAIPVSSSRLRNTTPRAVPGCCRCVTSPATATVAPGRAVFSSAASVTPWLARSGRMWSIGCVP